MASKPDPLFPGFETDRVAIDGGQVFVRMGGPETGAPLLLLHGFPETGAMWAPVAARLAAEGRFRLIAPDLPGYGESALAAGESSPERMSKRRLAADMVALMAALGHQRFDLAGHDRGARVAYRMAFDHPGAVQRVAVLDIIPTLEYWERCVDRSFNLGIYHWTFLAQPAPLPEMLIEAAPAAYCDSLITSWSGAKNLSAFAPEALALYRAGMADPDIRRAMCDDYRAGALIDPEHDAADRAAGRRIAAPLLALWGGKGIARRANPPDAIWPKWAESVTGGPIDCGHFLPEESPAETAAALSVFFS